MDLNFYWLIVNCWPQERLSNQYTKHFYWFILNFDEFKFENLFLWKLACFSLVFMIPVNIEHSFEWRDCMSVRCLNLKYWYNIITNRVACWARKKLKKKKIVLNYFRNFTNLSHFLILFADVNEVPRIKCNLRKHKPNRKPRTPFTTVRINWFFFCCYIFVFYFIL